MVFAFAGDSTMTRFFCSIKKKTADEARRVSGVACGAYSL
jgi:hypothetical protein